MKRYVKAARVGREKEVYVVQEYTGYGYGWEDVCTYSDTSLQSLREAKQDVKDYRDNGFSARVITRRIPNPDYVEPTNELTSQMIKDYFTGDKASLILDDLYSHGEFNYLLGFPNDYQHRCQVWENSDGEIFVYNCNTHRSKKVYTMQQFEQSINKILNIK